MTAKSTPGPWKLRDDGREYCGQTIEAECMGYGSAIAHATQRDPHPTLGGGIDQETAEANARLMASSPDLLAALQALHSNGALIRYLGDSQHTTEIKRKALNAIAKATGEQP